MNELAQKEIPLVTGNMDIDESNKYLLLVDKHPTLEDIYILEELLFQDAYQAQFALKHYWIGGIYAREIFIPKGSVLVGKMHAHEQITVLTKGELSVMSEEGMIRVKAPFVMINKPGLKRAGFAHEDTICMGFYHNPDDIRDIGELEKLLIIPPEDLKRLNTLKSLENTSCGQQ